MRERHTRNDEKTRGRMLGKSLKGKILSQKIILEIEKCNVLSNVQVVPLGQVLEVTES